MVIPTCKSVYVDKLQLDVNLLLTKCTHGNASIRKLGKFDGRNDPISCFTYADGRAYVDLFPYCATKYSEHVSSRNCLVPRCPEAGFSSTVGSIQRIECLTHMQSRISQLSASKSPAADLTENDMPPLIGADNRTPARKESSDSID